MIGAVDFSNLDSNALKISIDSLLIIFSVIVSLVVIFSIAPGIRNYFRKTNSSGNLNAGRGKLNNSSIPAGDSAAIAAAIYLFMDEIHDNENRVVTIKRVSRTYSPWNSKIYGINWLKNK